MMATAPEAASRAPRVAVAVPTHDKLDATFAMDLGRMMAYMGAGVAEGVLEACSLNFITGTYIAVARQDFALEAIRQEVDYVLWLDSDMRFPRDIYFRLAQHQKELVGINYSTRGVDARFVAIKTIGDKKDKIPARCVTRPESKGLEEVEAIGFGATLLRTSVLARLHDPNGPRGPWFMNAWSPETCRRIGEDVYFCRLVRESGGKVFVDHDTSRLCAHTGSFEYKIDHAFAFLNFEEDEADEEEDSD